MSDKQVRGQYTQEFKLEAVGQVKAGQSVISRPCKIPQTRMNSSFFMEMACTNSLKNRFTES